MDDVREFAVHPAAAAFPMIGDDEMLELAQDIKHKGLLYPIVLDYTGQILVDGRNRLKACALAGVEPRFDRLPEGTDLDEYVLSVNIARRHMNASQRAISVALIWPEARRGQRTDLDKNCPSGVEVHSTTLAHAREIVRYHDLARMVLSTAMKFGAALNEARLRSQIATNTEHYLAQLEAFEPELADAVHSEEMSLYDAWKDYERRREANAAAIQQVRDQLQAHVGWLQRATAFFADDEMIELLHRHMRDPQFHELLTADLDLRAIRRGCNAFVEAMR